MRSLGEYTSSPGRIEYVDDKLVVAECDGAYCNNRTPNKSSPAAFSLSLLLDFPFRLPLPLSFRPIPPPELL